MGFSNKQVLRVLLALGFGLVLSACGHDGRVDATAELETSFNHTPVIERIVPDPARVDAGESVAFSVQVDDQDGDPLRFHWIAGCEGDFDDPSAQEPVFTLIEVDSDTCTFTLEVTDDWGAATQGAVTITTGPPVNGG